MIWNDGSDEIPEEMGWPCKSESTKWLLRRKKTKANKLLAITLAKTKGGSPVRERKCGKDAAQSLTLRNLTLENPHSIM